MQVEKYVKPKSLDEAYEILNSQKDAQIIGGGLFSRISSKRISTGIDLFDLGLNYVDSVNGHINIGSMTSFGQMESSPILKKYHDGLLLDSIKDVVGTAFKNMATIGGTVFGRYGFSESLTALLALGARVFLYKGGEVSLEEYLEKKSRQRDIITKIIVPKAPFGVYKYFKNSYGDFPILTLALANDGSKYSLAVGARPKVARLAKKSALMLNEGEITKKQVDKISQSVLEELDFGKDTRASKEYRQEICKVLIKRAILKED